MYWIFIFTDTRIFSALVCRTSRILAELSETTV